MGEYGYISIEDGLQFRSPDCSPILTIPGDMKVELIKCLRFTAVSLQPGFLQIVYQMRQKGLQMQMKSGILHAGANINIFWGRAEQRPEGLMLTETILLLIYYFILVKMIVPQACQRMGELEYLYLYMPGTLRIGGATCMWLWSISPPVTLLACLGGCSANGVHPWSQKSESQLCLAPAAAKNSTGSHSSLWLNSENNCDE